MPQYVDLTRLLREDGCFVPPLAVLRPDNGFARVMLLQPQGNLLANDQTIGNADNILAHSKHLAFLQLAYLNQPALVATPEYSTPWSTIRAILEAELLPSDGNIWILGCESIRPNELSELISAFQDNVIWHCDMPDPLPQNRTYVDPALLIFRVVKDNQSKVCIAVQLKCLEMGGDQEFIERDHLILGITRYYVENPENSIRLTALICSDALGFNHTALPQYLYVPYFIVHIQCSLDPYRALLKRYRDNAYLHPEGDRYQFLSLNWASGTEINGESTANTLGGSCLYLKPRSLDEREPRQNDNWIDANHIQGGYLKFCYETRHACIYFSSQEAVLDFTCTKASQELSPVANQDRAGVQGLSARTWSPATSQWLATPYIEDGIGSLVQAQGIASLVPLTNQPSLRERLIAFSIGEFKPQRAWHVPCRFRSYEVDHATELPHGTLVRLRHHQDGVIHQALQIYRTLEGHILTNHAEFPAEFYDLRGKAITLYGVNTAGHADNLAANATPVSAAMIFLGDTSEIHAHQFHDDVLRELRPNRLAVWYRDGVTIRQISSGLRKYSSPETDRTDISRGSL